MDYEPTQSFPEAFPKSLAKAVPNPKGLRSAINNPLKMIVLTKNIDHWLLSISREESEGLPLLSGKNSDRGIEGLRVSSDLHLRGPLALVFCLHVSGAGEQIGEGSVLGSPPRVLLLGNRTPEALAFALILSNSYAASLKNQGSREYAQP